MGSLNNIRHEPLPTSDVEEADSEIAIIKNGNKTEENSAKNSHSDNNGSCGLGSCKPQWLQRFATRRTFMVVFSLMGIIQTMTWSYFVATITTVEKRFKIQSRTTGIMMMGNEISQIALSVVLSYYGSRGHRPRWIAIGVAFGGVSCFLMALPQFLYGSGEDSLSLTWQYVGGDADPNIISNSTARNEDYLCYDDKSDSNSDQCNRGDYTIIPMVIFFLAQFVAGIAVSLYFTLGGPYMDDNIKKTQTPMMFGVLMCFRMLGPTMGFLMASVCLKLFINPFLTPLIDNKDPRWLGAWWLGWLVVGCGMLISSVFMAMFPRDLPHHSSRVQKANVIKPAGSELMLSVEPTEGVLPKVNDLPSAVKRLVRNGILMCNIMSTVFYVFGGVGYWTYSIKYMETVFRQTASTASVVSGTVSIFFMAIGLLVSGALISKFRPCARILAGWNVVIGILWIIAYLSFITIGCETLKMDGIINEDTGLLELTSSCNANCSCASIKFTPVCMENTGITYYSPCHAGCHQSTVVDGVKMYGDCSCIESVAESSSVSSTYTTESSEKAGFPVEGISGQCAGDCFVPFIIFLTVHIFIRLVDNTGRIGNVLVTYRCVSPEEKSLAVGLSIFLVSLMSLIPAPIFFGALVDSACSVWGEKCGERGNCWLYSSQKLQLYMNLAASGFTVFAVVFDILVWYLVKDLDLYGEHDPPQKEMEEIQ